MLHHYSSNNMMTSLIENTSLILIYFTVTAWKVKKKVVFFCFVFGMALRTKLWFKKEFLLEMPSALWSQIISLEFFLSVMTSMMNTIIVVRVSACIHCGCLYFHAESNMKTNNDVLRYNLGLAGPPQHWCLSLEFLLVGWEMPTAGGKISQST